MNFRTQLPARLISGKAQLEWGFYSNTNLDCIAHNSSSFSNKSKSIWSRKIGLSLEHKAQFPNPDHFARPNMRRPREATRFKDKYKRTVRLTSHAV